MTTIGRFQVVRELSRGSNAVVSEVMDRGRPVALKMLTVEAMARRDVAVRFQREFHALQAVQHPHVVTALDAGMHDGLPWFTMELSNWSDLRHWVDSAPLEHTGAPPEQHSPELVRALNDPARRSRIVSGLGQLVSALAAVHDAGFVHRDVQFNNVMVHYTQTIKLIDFGIAYHRDDAEDEEGGGLVVGTFKYLAPEQALGAPIDGRADLYCLGVMLYELLAGRHPFYSENSVGYAYHHARKPPPPLERFNPDVDRELAALCMQLLKKDPRERPHSAADVLDALRGRALHHAPAATPDELPQSALDVRAAIFVSIRNAMAGQDLNTRNSFERARAAAEKVLSVMAAKLGGADTTGWADGLAREVCGAGPLTELLEDNTVREIVVRGPQDIRVRRDRQLESAPGWFSSDASLAAVIERVRADATGAFDVVGDPPMVTLFRRGGVSTASLDDDVAAVPPAGGSRGTR